MSLDSPLLLSSIWWLLETAANAIWGAFSVWAVICLIRRRKMISAWAANALSRKERPRRKRRGMLRRFFRKFGLQERNWIRAHRFDPAWIQRESGRGHAFLVIFIVYFGLWVLALGLKEVLILSNAPLSQSPELIFVSALPMYGFEIAWLVYGGRASRLLVYRRKARIWRWRISGSRRPLISPQGSSIELCGVNAEIPAAARDNHDPARSTTCLSPT